MHLIAASIQLVDVCCFTAFGTLRFLKRIVTDTLDSYRVAPWEPVFDVIHDMTQYASNRADRPDESTMDPSQCMWHFKY